MAAVTGYDVAAFLGHTDDATLADLAGQHVAIVTAMARAYTRGRGFDPVTGVPFDDVAAVITTATARLVTNPQQATGPTTVGAIIRPAAAVFAGWTLAETFVLNRYRARAQ